MATVLTNLGKAAVTGLLSALASATPAYSGWGTGAGTAAITDTALFTESADEARAATTLTQQTTTTTNDTLRATATMTCAVSGKTITNAGLWTASSGGSLLFHGDFTGVVLAVSDSISFTYNIQFT